MPAASRALTISMCYSLVVLVPVPLNDVGSTIPLVSLAPSGSPRMAFECFGTRGFSGSTTASCATEREAVYG